MTKRAKTQTKENTVEQITAEQIEEVLKNIGFEKKGDKFYMPKDEKGNIMEAIINDGTLEIIVENKKRNVSAKGRINFGKTKEDLPTLGSIEETMETGLGLDDIVKRMAESVLLTVNDEIIRIDIECMEKIEFENDVDLLNDGIGKAVETGNKLLNLLKEVGAKDAYMSGRLAVLLADLPCYEAAKVAETDGSVKPDMLVGSVSGVNVHVYSNLSWGDNTVYYK